ncbi:Alpha/Beta hydrolase protein [Mycena vitilis]|nr:Alpha/Beta hydrolase protein [Mycena vitilis]
MKAIFLLPSLILALFLSLSLASPVAFSSSPQTVLTTRPESRDTISLSLYNEFVLYTKYSSTAYRYSSAMYTGLCPRPLGNTLVKLFERGRTQAFIALDENREEIHSAGSGIKWAFKLTFVDLNFPKVPFESRGIAKKVRVHRGFLAAYNDVVDEVLAIVKKQLEDFPSYSIVVTGHSLGGAVASLAAPSIKTAHPEVPLKLYTFAPDSVFDPGQPRVGTPKFATYVEETIGVENIFRGILHSCVVPSILTHPGTEYWQFREPIPLIIPAHETVKKCEGCEDFECSLSNVFTHMFPFHMLYFGHMMSVPMAKLKYCL